MLRGLQAVSGMPCCVLNRSLSKAATAKHGAAASLSRQPIKDGPAVIINILFLCQKSGEKMHLHGEFGTLLLQTPRQTSNESRSWPV